MLTRRSAPEDFKAAQSNGLCPGAKAILALFFAGNVGLVVVAFGANVADGNGSFCNPKKDEDDDDKLKPGFLLARLGSGGGGMRSVSVNILGMPGAARCALFKAGNAGGESSSPIVSAPSSSVESIGSDTDISNVGAAGASQLRRYEAIFCGVGVKEG